MNDPWVNFNRSTFSLMPYITGFMFVSSAGLLIAWVLGATIAPLRAPIGGVLNFRFAPEEGQFFGLIMLGSAAGYGFYRLFRGYVNSR